MLFLFVFLCPGIASSEIIVHDMISPGSAEVMLKAETRGTLLRKGGEVIEFFIKKKSIGKTLSGGDGIAFRQFSPRSPGLYQIIAKSGGEEGMGCLLSLRQGARLLFVDVEGALLDSMLSLKPRKGSQQMIKQLSEKMPVVYLQTGMLGVSATKKWLREQGFREQPVLPWEQGIVFDETAEKGLMIKAIIGGPKVIGSAGSHTAKKYSFEDVEGAEEVRDWEEIGRRLKQ